MVYARDPKAAAELSKTIQQGEMVKEYVTMVHGEPSHEDRLEDLLFKDSRKNKVFCVKKERKGVKKAVLQYRVLDAGEQSLVHVLFRSSAPRIGRTGRTIWHEVSKGAHYRSQNPVGKLYLDRYHQPIVLSDARTATSDGLCHAPRAGTYP